MSFSRLPPEIVMQIFSNLRNSYDIPGKVRLQRVNKKWRDCIRRPESWKFNTDLRISFDRSMFKSELVEAKIALLDFSPQITSVSLSGSNDGPEYLADSLINKLWEKSHKLRLTRLELHNLCGPDDYEVGCKKEHLELCLRLIAPSPDTVKYVRIYCCEFYKCKLRAGFGRVLHACPALQQLEWVARYSGLEDIQDALRDLPIRRLMLDIAKGGGFGFARALNAIQNSSIRILDIPDCYFFKFDDFVCELLPIAAAPIQVLKIDGNIRDLFDFLPDFPTVFPNLAMVEASYIYDIELCDEVSIVIPKKIAQAIGGFIKNACGRDVPLTLNLEITGNRIRYSNQLWGALNLISGCKSGAKRGKGNRKWKKTLGDTEVKVCIQSITRKL